MDSAADDAMLHESLLGPNSWLEPGPAAYDFRGKSGVHASTYMSLLTSIII